MPEAARKELGFPRGNTPMRCLLVVVSLLLLGAFAIDGVFSDVA